jgi:hypothetical protein
VSGDEWTMCARELPALKSELSTRCHTGIHRASPPATHNAPHVLLPMRRHILTALRRRLPHQQGPCRVECARHGAGAAAVDVAPNIQQVTLEKETV